MVRGSILASGLQILLSLAGVKPPVANLPSVWRANIRDLSAKFLLLGGAPCQVTR